MEYGSRKEWGTGWLIYRCECGGEILRSSAPCQRCGAVMSSTRSVRVVELLTEAEALWERTMRLNHGRGKRKEADQKSAFGEINKVDEEEQLTAMLRCVALRCQALHDRSMLLAVAVGYEEREGAEICSSFRRIHDYASKGIHQYNLRAFFFPLLLLANAR